MSQHLPDAELSLDSVVTVSSQQVSCDMAGEAVILSLRDGVYYGLDPIAARIWQLLQEGGSIRSVRDTLLEEYEGVDEDRCTRELTALLERLRACALVEITPASQG